jgi:2-polyprenyl-6-methoxyphenol hydroxylase-like FAD-dependent oxidoreductase
MDSVECVVIGAGVIGLAVARALALAGFEVVVLERAYTIGFETSSRNSEVSTPGSTIRAAASRRAVASPGVIAFTAIAVSTAFRTPAPGS